MKIKSSFFILLLLLFNTNFLSAQTEQVEMSDALLANGKIYVVVTVLCIVFTGIVTFLIMTDRKVSALEKKVNNKE